MIAASTICWCVAALADVLAHPGGTAGGTPITGRDPAVLVADAHRAVAGRARDGRLFVSELGRCTYTEETRWVERHT